MERWRRKTTRTEFRIYLQYTHRGELSILSKGSGVGTSSFGDDNFCDFRFAENWAGVGRGRNEG